MLNLLKVVVVGDDGRDESIVFSREVQDIEVARQLAESSCLIVLAKGMFNELLH